MIILPAIDIIDGKPVRLYQGRYDTSSIVAESVFETARNFEKQGAEYLHMVDLDGARMKKPVNADLIIETARSVSIPAEVGGGIRSMEDIDLYLENGLDRVILGTSALEDENLLKEAVEKYGRRIAVGIDIKDGYVAVNGWMETSKVPYLEFAKKMEQAGVQTLICTDISKDGTLAGPNLDMLEKLKNSVSCSITASGGMAEMKDLENCAALGLYGAITGKALYSGAIDLKEAVERIRTC